MILDAALLTLPEIEVAKNLNEAGVRLFQYRNKRGVGARNFSGVERTGSQSSLNAVPLFCE